MPLIQMVSPQLREFSHCLSKTHLRRKSTRKSNERIGLEGFRKRAYGAKNTSGLELNLKARSRDSSLRKQPTFGDATTGFPAK